MSILNTIFGSRSGQAPAAAPASTPTAAAPAVRPSTSIPAAPSPHTGGASKDPGVSASDLAEVQAHRPAVPQAKQLRPYEQFGRVPISLATFKAVAARMRVAPTGEETAKLSDLQVKFERLRKFIGDHDNEAVREYAKEQHRKIARLVAEGKGEEAAQLDVFTKDELAEEFASKRSLAKKELHSLTQEAIAVAVPVLDRVGKAAAKLAAQLEGAERKVYEDLGGVRYHPSLLVVTIGQLEWRAAEEFLPGVGAYPPGMLLDNLK